MTDTTPPTYTSQDVRRTFSDPMERLIADALTSAGIAFASDLGGGNPVGLDFYLPAADLHIEVKRFHSDRIGEQMSRAPNVIAAQGEAAVRFLADAIVARSRSNGMED